MLKSVTTLTAIFLTAGLAHADVNVADPAAQGLSCSQAREAAWFLGELARTDGNVEPAGTYAPCDADGRSFGGTIQPVVYRPGGRAAEGMTCKETRQADWFLGELARTDGNNDPEAATTECGIEGDHYAEFGLDAD